MERPNTQSILNSLSLILLLTGLWIFFVVSPVYTDDLRFSLTFADRYFNAKPGFPWDEILDSISSHRALDNGRLGNIVVMPFLAIPKWIGASVSTIAWALAIWSGLQMAGVSMRTSVLVPLASLLWLVCMVWTDGMDGLVFQFNYIIPTLLGIRLLVLLRTDKYKGRMLGIILLSLLLGIWQEAIACPVMVMAGVMYFQVDKSRRNAIIVAICLLFTGMCYLTWHYLFVVNVSEKLKMGSNIVSTLLYHRGFLVMLIMSVLAVCKNGFRKTFGNDVVVLMFIGGIISILVPICTTGAVRAAWWSDFCGVICSIALLQGMLRLRGNGDYRILKMLKFLIPVVIMLIVIIPGDAVMIHNSRSFSQAVDMHRNNPRNLVYSDFITNDRIPLVAWPLVCTGLYRCQMEMNAIDKFFFKDEMNDPRYVKFVMIPNELKELPKYVKSNLMLYKGRLIGTTDYPELQEGDLWTDTVSVYGKKIACYAIALQSTPAGTRYVWYAPIGRQRLPSH